jgi:hypothetical protein
MSSSEQQFRESLRSFRWASNSNNNVNSNKTSTFSQLTENTSNFFGSVSNRVRGYVPLSNNNVEEEEDWLTLTRWQVSSYVLIKVFEFYLKALTIYYFRDL